MNVYTQITKEYQEEIEVLDGLITEIKEKIKKCKKKRNTLETKRLVNQLYILRGMRNDCTYSKGKCMTIARRYK